MVYIMAIQPLAELFVEIFLEISPSHYAFKWISQQPVAIQKCFKLLYAEPLDDESPSSVKLYFER